jgi:predicted AAA+ superfamily ATPase
VDEAQKIPDIGNKLKLITDQIKDVGLVVTGSSSFELAKGVNESLTGRKREYRLYPVSFQEMVRHTDLLSERRMLKHRMVFGYYPEVVTHLGEEKAILKELADSYLYKDILSLKQVGKPDKLVRLVQALALQVGSQVSYNELGQLVGLDAKTVEKYIDILEKSFILFRLPSFSRNHRNELKSSRKVYFRDLGIRNAVIGNLAPFEARSPEEIGHLWENFLMTERMKYQEYTGSLVRSWFWRTLQQKEIDLVEEQDGRLETFEFKWHTGKPVKAPASFTNAYPDAGFRVITPDNFSEFLL